MRTRPKTLAVTLLGRAVLNFIMTAKVVGLVICIIIGLNCQYPLPPINWGVLKCQKWITDSLRGLERGEQDQQVWPLLC